MKFLISKKLINSISNFRDRIFKKSGPTSGNESMDKYFTLARDNKTWEGAPDKDDFNWSIYHLHYRGEVELGAKENTQTLRDGDYEFLNGELVKTNKDILPLPANHRLPYETILQLNPESVFELGVGNGMLLNNIQTLSSEIKLSGIDLSEKQLEFLRESYPNLRADVRQYDATVPFDDSFQKVDLAYTHAVIMHIKTDDSHLVVLANLFNISQKYVVLMENWQAHEFLKDVRYLFNKKLISWDKLYVYYRIAKEDPSTRVMICSRSPLNYSELTDYREMTKGIESQNLFVRFRKWLRA